MRTIRPSRFGWAALLCVVLVAAGCGKDDDSNNANNQEPDTGIMADANDTEDPADADVSNDTGDEDADTGSTDADTGTADADTGNTDADTGSDTDGGTQGEGLRLTGGIVPAGGTQMSSSFTLNGGIEQPAESTTVESASFKLELTQPTSEGGTP